MKYAQSSARGVAFAVFAVLSVSAFGGLKEITVAPGGTTPQQALEQIRAAKAAGDNDAWAVRVKKGVHALKESLVFTPADSGSPDAPVTWVGEEGAVFSGGEPVKGWKVLADGTWEADLPKTPKGETAYFEQLWVNGRRADRARLPNRCPAALSNEYYKVSKPEIVAVSNAAGQVTGYVETLGLTNADVVAALAATPADELAFAQMCVVHKWSFARRVLRGFDAAKGIVTTHSPSPWNRWQKWSARETIVSFENVRAGFDAPGEWFYDAKAGKLRYRPLPGETPEAALVVAPSSKLSRLVDFRGDPDKREYVHDVAFHGIEFAYGDATPTSDKAIRAEHPDVVAARANANGPTESWQHQAASGSDGCINLFGAKRVSFASCKFAHVGNYGLRFDDGCVSNSVVDCTIEDVGAGGVWMGSKRGEVAEGEELTRRVIRPNSPRATAFNLIDNCVIRNGGRFNPEGTGVAYTHVSDSKVTHCDIHDFYYTGVSVGWTWGFQGSVAQRNEVAFNRIWDLGKGVMSDMGGVYTLATSYGTTVHDNVIHDVWSYSYGGWALYTDEGSEGIVMERNLCWNTTDGGFHQHYGTGCVIRNNVFAWNRMLGAVRMYRDVVQEIPCSLHFQNNVVLVREGPLVGRGARRVGGTWLNNVWWNSSGDAPEFDGLKGWDAWLATGRETASVYADPMFADAEKFDFALKPESPAFKLGFKAWDYSAAGARKKIALPGEPALKPAVSPAPFPDRISAFVWRNWLLVPKATLARVVGATPEQLAAVAAEMGLPKNPEILPEWHRRGYITVLRRNWHLLDYEQILDLLGMTRDELRFSLLEDDFLWVKLGRVKPFCRKLVYDAASAKASAPARRKLAKILAEENALDFSEEPRFDFVKKLAAPDPSLPATPAQVVGSPFDFRLIFSYFADYGDPLGDPEIGSYPDGLLQRLAADGVNAVWLHTVLRTLVKDPKYPEFGEGSEKRVANLRKLVARAAKYGVKVYLYVNEPRAMTADFFAADPAREAMKGAPSRDGLLHSMCISTPEGRRFLHDSLKQLFSNARGLGGIFTITASENYTTCASHGREKLCPHCKGRGRAELIAEANRVMIEGMTAGDPNAEALVWNWAWPSDGGGEAAVVANLPKKNCRLMSVSERLMPFERGGVKGVERDYAISIVGPGEVAKSLWKNARANSIPTVAKVQANCSWELSAFPYLPVVDLVAEHANNLVKEGVDGVMLSWSLGCCPAPNLRVFRDVRKDDPDRFAVERRLAESLYGAEAVDAVLAAWKAYADGFREYPFSVGVLYNGPQQWGPANPLYLEPTGWKSTMVGIPYDCLDGWRSEYPAATWVAQMAKVAAGFGKGNALFAAALAKMPPAKRAAAERELKMFRAETLHFLSAADQARFVMARDAGDKAEMRRVAERELVAAKEMLALARADSRFGFESSNHYFYVPQDLREKILACRAAIEATR